MFLYWVMILDIYISFSASVQCFLMCCVMLCCNKVAEHQVNTPQIGRKTPTKGLYSSSHLVITK